MPLQLMGTKKGMTRIFDERGDSIVCTVIETKPNVVVQLKSKEKDGYVAVQMGARKVPSTKLKNVKKPLKEHFAKAKVEPRSALKESRIDETENFTVGQEVGLEYFADTIYVDVIGITKGKGFQGVIKRHGFSGGPAAHGSGFHRTAGSTGMRSTPGRTLPGLRMAGHMGNVRMTVEGLKVIRVDPEKNVIFVKGAVPGSKGSLVTIRKSRKRRGKSG